MNKHNMKVLINALLDGDQAVALEETKRLLENGEGRERIISDGVEAAMTRLDNKCTADQFNLLEIMLAGRAVTAVIKELYPPAVPPLQTKGTVVTGTLEGDVHDLGKTILKGVLTAKRYRVVDCGKDCPVEKMTDVAEIEAAMAICVSGLITTVIPQVRLLRTEIVGRGLGHIKLIAGGAALKQGSAGSLGVDFVADTAFDALHYLESLMEMQK
jgi:dimethylamine corrinoid protein